MLSKIKTFCEQIFSGLYNLFYYFPVIWKDRDYEFFFNEKLMLAKLKKHYKFKISQSKYDKSKTDIQAMRICISILERRADSWYTKTWHEKFAYKQTLEFSPVIEGNEESDLIKMVGLTKEEENQSLKSLQDFNSIEKRDWGLFCDIHKQYFETWWD